MHFSWQHTDYHCIALIYTSILHHVSTNVHCNGGAFAIVSNWSFDEHEALFFMSSCMLSLNQKHKVIYHDTFLDYALVLLFVCVCLLSSSPSLLLSAG